MFMAWSILYKKVHLKKSLVYFLHRFILLPFNELSYVPEKELKTKTIIYHFNWFLMVLQNHFKLIAFIEKTCFILYLLIFSINHFHVVILIIILYPSNHQHSFGFYCSECVQNLNQGIGWTSTILRLV